ncbi:MAG TPA: MBL fold metallo-hydrolase [Solirubrobacteraceae bacterium]|nr:MBL fold metallo-hydrolase [Solirubrobacteraceae bacterium]
MTTIEAIPIPLPHIGSVNAWLLRGDPLTLLDTGPYSDVALDALERGLRACGVAMADIELVIGTHHHHDHVGLAATVRRASGARIAVSCAAADYAERYHENVGRDRAFARELMRGHGVPDELLGSADALWEYIGATAEPFAADIRLRDGDVIRAGGRNLRVLSRPGHSHTDTMFVDSAARLAFVGDHLLAKISPNTEIVPGIPRPRPRVDYIHSLKQTASMPLQRLFPGHGPPLSSAAERVRRELAHSRRRCRRIIAALERGDTNAFAVARRLWPEAIVREQALLVVWEVLGHLDVMLTAGIAREARDDDGRWRYTLARDVATAPRREQGLVLAG